MKKNSRKIKLFLKKWGNRLYWVFVGFVLFLGVVVFLSVFNIGNVHIYSVMSGSMSPKIFAGSLAVVMPQESYAKDDVITYKTVNPADLSAQGSVTHRIVELKEEGGETVYLTKGDKNPSQDPKPVSKKDIVGKMVISIPLIGYASSFAKTPAGFVLLVIVPCMAIIISEIVKLVSSISVPKRKEAI
jgi:signal peptidase